MSPAESALLLALGKILGVLVQLRDGDDAAVVDDGIAAASATVSELRKIYTVRRQEINR